MNEAQDGAEGPLSPVALRVLLDHRARFFEFLTRRTSSSELAEEILQDALAKALERGGQLHDDDSHGCLVCTCKRGV